MAELIKDTNLTEPDQCYTAIIDAHRELSDEQSSELNARLVLILTNHIGDKVVLDEALALARLGLD
ncbi:MAG: DUF2783 domain-containing protein [Hyphomicrobiales bacterium]